MREKLKYFIINIDYDYNRGICDNMKVRDNSLHFHSNRNSGVGRYLTRIFDAGEHGMVWHRLVIHTKSADTENLRITVFASDKNEMNFHGDRMTLYDLFDDPTFTMQEKLDAYKPFIVKKASGASDLLLHDVIGRYVWVLIELYSAGVSAKIIDVRLFLPAASWIDYLPKIYRNSDGDTHFLERYLGIFQTIYEELDAEIEEMSHRFDPESTELSFLHWLAEWLNISDTSIWTEEQLRQLLLKAVRLYRLRGTKEALSEIIELYTGEKPFIVEGFNIKEMAGSVPNGKRLLEMYGGNPYTVTVLVKPGHDMDVIRRIAGQMLPITAELNLVELDPYIFLDNYAYIGVNSSLEYYQPAVLDGNSQLMLSTLGNEPEDQQKDK